MKKKLLFSAERLAITLRRLCAELIEQHGSLSETLLLGLQPRGVFLAKRLQVCLEALGQEPPLGELDTTFHRDDFSRGAKVHTAYPTHLTHTLEGQNVVLVDDVLYTGRTVRAALDALLAYGRPHRIELLVLIDRVQCRDVPIEANYIGQRVSTLRHQHIHLELTEQDKKKDGIWLVQKEIPT